MSDIIFYCCDLETNGLVHRNNFHEICEFSIVRSTDRVQLSRQVRINNPQNSSFDAMKICGKTMEDYKKGISQKQLLIEVEEFLLSDGLTPEHRCIVGHNIINFDRKFLWQLWSTHNKLFPASLYLDTLNMMKGFTKKNKLVKQALNLEASCNLMNVKKRPGKHTAKSDSQNTFLLWEKLMEEVDYLDYIKRIPHIENDY